MAHYEEIQSRDGEGTVVKSEDEMDYITSHQEELLGTILEIKCSGISHDRDNNFSVMHPVYKKPRTDKSVANTLAECVEIDVAASLL